jgi:excisionase family DNA binding protein
VSSTHEKTSDPLLTVAEIAHELRVSPATVRTWVAKGRLRATRSGERKWLVRRSDVDRMMAADNPQQPLLLPEEPDQSEDPEERAARKLTAVLICTDRLVQAGAGAQQLLELHIAALELIQSAKANRSAHSTISREAIDAAIRAACR